MIAQVYYLFGQTERKRGHFLDEPNIYLSSKYLLHMGVILTISKLFTILFLLFSLSVEIRNNFAAFKINQ